MSRTTRITALTAAFCLAATLAFALVPALRFAYRAPSLRVALETTAALIALLAAFLVFGRVRRTRQLDHLLLAFGLATVSVANFAVALLLAVQPEASRARLVTFAASIVGLALIGVSAWAPQRAIERPGRVALVVFASTAVPVALISLGLFEAAGGGGRRLAGPLDTGRPQFARDPWFVLAQATAVLASTTAAIGFARRAGRTADEFLHFLAVATVLAATSRVHYLLFAPIYTGWVYTGDVFRLLFYVVLVVGAGYEILAYWRSQTSVAVLEERRRIARELHDGMAQELAFISRRAHRLTATEEVAEIAAAADRALVDSRRAIAALTRPLDEPLEYVLAQAAEDVASRLGVGLELDLARGVEVTGDEREALLRIACEAVANAARHSRADVVRLALTGGDHVRLRIDDDGVGFDPAAVEGGYGLVAMRERAEQLGASFRLESAPRGGTSVEVVLP